MEATPIMRKLLKLIYFVCTLHGSLSKFLIILQLLLNGKQLVLNYKEILHFNTFFIAIIIETIAPINLYCVFNILDASKKVTESLKMNFLLIYSQQYLQNP